MADDVGIRAALLTDGCLVVGCFLNALSPLTAVCTCVSDTTCSCGVGCSTTVARLDCYWGEFMKPLLTGLLIAIILTSEPYTALLSSGVSYQIHVTCIHIYNIYIYYYIIYSRRCPYLARSCHLPRLQQNNVRGKV